MENNYKINEKYDKIKIEEILSKFDEIGEIVVVGARNTIKKFPYEILSKRDENNKKIEKYSFSESERNLVKYKEINIKKFSKKNKLIKWYYKKNEGSKAERSYNFGNKLLQLGIKTPEPIAYYDEFYVEKEKTTRSFYVCENLDYDFSFREVLWNEGITPKIEEILQNDYNNIINEFTKFTFEMHEKNIYFGDYTPGNILVKIDREGRYNFYLIDLNRIKFCKLNIYKRMENVCKMIAYSNIKEQFCREYAKLYNVKYEKILKILTFYINKHKLRDLFKDKTRKLRYFFRKK